MAEVLHKLMVAEIASKHGMNRLEVSRLIKRRSSVISELERCETAIQEIPDFDIEVLPLMSGAVIESRSLRSEHQLMTNDFHQPLHHEAGRAQRHSDQRRRFLPDTLD